MFLGEYLMPVILISAALGLISFVSYPQFSDKTVKFAASVLIIYTALFPCISFINDISNMDFEGCLEDIKNESVTGTPESERVAEEAFKEGICKLIVTKYGIKRENINIYVFDFSFEKMSAEAVKIILSGKASLSDLRGMEIYLNTLSLGEVEVIPDI